MVDIVTAYSSKNPQFYIDNDFRKTEGSSGNSNLQVVLRLSRDKSNKAVAYNYQVSVNRKVNTTGKMASATDFAGDVLPSGSGTFALGEDTKTINIPIKGNTTVDGNRIFYLNVTSSVKGVKPISILCTIIDDDVYTEPKEIVKTGPASVFNQIYGVVPKLRAQPPSLSNPIIVDLNEFDPTGAFPGWDGTRPSQSTANSYANRYPSNRDVYVIGHRSAWWTGSATMYGGRRVKWEGGSYTQSVLIARCFMSGHIEGVRVRFPFDPVVVNYFGDGVTVYGDPTRNGQVQIYILNCRVDGVDGASAAGHGDVFQIPAGASSGTTISGIINKTYIERISATTAYQGLMLSQQKIDPAITQMPELVSITDFDITALRDKLYTNLGTIVGNPVYRDNVSLIYPIDEANLLNSGIPYPIHMDNGYVRQVTGGDHRNGYGAYGTGRNGITLSPLIDDNGRLTYHESMLITGYTQIGDRPGGNLVPYNASGKGGLNIPGMGYISPGYEQVAARLRTPAPVIEPNGYNFASMPGLFSWYDPTDDQSVTLSNTPAANTITSVTGKGTPLSFVQDGAVPLPTRLNHYLGLHGRKISKHDGSPLLATNAAVINPIFGGVNKPFTMAVVVRPSNITGFQNIMMFGRGDSGNDGFGLACNNGTYSAYFYKTGTLIQIQDTQARAVNKRVNIVKIIYDGTNATLNVDGVDVATGPVSQTARAINNIMIGGTRHGVAAAAMYKGDIMLALAGSQALSGQALTNLHNGLVQFAYMKNPQA